MNTSPPITASAEPDGSADTVDQWILSATRMMNTTVSTPVTTVMTVCRRMIRSKPITPPKMVSATTTIIAMIFVPVPPPQPRCWNTVAIASVARITRMVSQPTVSSHERAVGSLLPRTPFAGYRDEPAQQERDDDPGYADHERLPERDPECQQERTVAQAEDRDVGGEPGPEQITRMALALGIGDDVDAVHFDLQRVRFGRAARDGARGTLSLSHGKPSYGLYCLTMSAGGVVSAPAAEPLNVIVVPSLIHDGLALAPVDRDVGAVDEAGPGRGQEGHQGRDLGRLADAAERDGPLGQFMRALLGHALVAGERLLQRVPPAGVHRPRVHRVDAHAMTPVLLGDRGSEVDVSGVRHPRGHLPVAGLEAVVADDEHDGAFPSLAHMRNDRAHRADVAHELEVEARHPLLFGQVLQQSTGRTARAGDQDVDLAEPVQGGLHAALDVLRHAHVAGHGHDRAARFGGDLLGGRRQGLCGPGGDDDIGLLAREMLGHRAADSLARAGDEGHLPGQLQIHRHPFRPLPDRQVRPPLPDRQLRRRIRTRRRRWPPWPPPGLRGWYTKYHPPERLARAVPAMSHDHEDFSPHTAEKSS